MLNVVGVGFFWLNLGMISELCACVRRQMR